MFGMFLWYVRHVPLTCSACSFSMFNMLIIHAHHVKTTCTYMFFPMFHVPCACSFLVAPFSYTNTNQTRYVSLSTNALTGTHSACLVIVAAWFIYRLKDESKLVMGFEALLRKCRWVLGRWIYALLGRDVSLHFQRNVCW